MRSQRVLFAICLAVGIIGTVGPVIIGLLHR
jgi:hypothetical protein